MFLCNATCDEVPHYIGGLSGSFEVDDYDNWSSDWLGSNSDRLWDGPHNAGVDQTISLNIMRADICVHAIKHPCEHLGDALWGSCQYD